MTWVPGIATKERSLSSHVVRSPSPIANVSKQVSSPPTIVAIKLYSSALGLNNQPPNHDFMPQLLTVDLTVHVSYLQK